MAILSIQSLSIIVLTNVFRNDWTLISGWMSLLRVVLMKRVAKDVSEIFHLLLSVLKVGKWVWVKESVGGCVHEDVTCCVEEIVSSL